MSPEEQEQRKQRVLTHGAPSVVSSIAEATVSKDGSLFMLTDRHGSVPAGEGHGFGLYHNDCRYLRAYELRIAGRTLNPLAAAAPEAYGAVFHVTNPELTLDDGTELPGQQVLVRITRVVDGEALSVREAITFENVTLEPLELPISFEVDGDFEDVFDVRGLLDVRLGKRRPPEWRDGTLRFAYDGGDGRIRSLSVSFDPPLEPGDDGLLHGVVSLAARGTATYAVELHAAESDEEIVARRSAANVDVASVRRSLARSAQEWRSQQATVSTDSVLLSTVLDRSFQDLHQLRTRIGDRDYFAAGIPWFATLFGRDSAITALQTLSYDPSIAEETLRLLACYQGERHDPWRDEQPGKMLHELRVGELARTGEIPHTPYFGTIDATPLFLILMSAHAKWTGRLDVFEDLREHVERALEWVRDHGDSNGDGYIDYQSTTDRGLINQGWKDSGDAIVDEEGRLARPPIALVEAQAYAYMARLEMADLYERSGDRSGAEELRREAEGLRERFERDFWDDELGLYVLALQQDGRPARVVSSNAGHALWAGIVRDDRAARTAERLMADDMFSGWGVRTLAAGERRYNPIGYHLGTVWPHDNSIIAAGFRRYGRHHDALRLFSAMLTAARHFPDDRIPELFSGFPRRLVRVPVHYPVACHPQAWAAGTLPYMLRTSLGLDADGFSGTLRVTRPMLPRMVDEVEIRDLSVGDGTVTLRVAGDGEDVSVEVLEERGGIEVVTELGD